MIGKTNPFAKDLRVNSTDAEQRLWQRLRNRQLGGHKFRRQVTVGPFIADFACIDARLIVEIDGGQHCEQRDGARTEFLTSRGYRVIRFWNHDVLENIEGVLQSILIKIEDQAPSPNPLPLAGEGF